MNNQNGNTGKNILTFTIDTLNSWEADVTEKIPTAAAFGAFANAIADSFVLPTSIDALYSKLTKEADIAREALKIDEPHFKFIS